MNKAWPLVKLGEVLHVTNRQTEVNPSHEYRLLGVRLDGGGPFLREQKFGSQLAANSLYEVKSGDFIYSRLFAWRGAFGVIDEQLDSCFVSNEFPTFLAENEKIDAHFLKYWFRLPHILKQVEADCTGSTPLTRNRYKENFFLNLQIPLPPLAEQQRIVAKIERLAGKIGEARELRKRAIAENESLASTQLHTIFHYLIRKHGSTKLEQLITEASYGTSEKCSPIRNKGDIPILRIPNVASEKINLDDLKFAHMSTHNYESLRLRNGDILVVRTNGSLDLVGRCAVVTELPEPTAFASYMIRLRFNKEIINPTYTQQMLRYLRISGQLTNFARTTAGQYNVSLGRLRVVEIPVPPIAEQLQILIELDNLQDQTNHLKSIQTQTTAELDAMLPSILDRAFKGEL